MARRQDASDLVQRNILKDGDTNSPTDKSALQEALNRRLSACNRPTKNDLKLRNILRGNNNVEILICKLVVMIQLTKAPEKLGKKA